MVRLEVQLGKKKQTKLEIISKKTQCYINTLILLLIIQSKGKASGTGSCSKGSAATVRKQQERAAIPWIPALLRTQVHVPGTKQAQTPLTTE